MLLDSKWRSELIVFALWALFIGSVVLLLWLDNPNDQQDIRALEARVHWLENQPWDTLYIRSVMKPGDMFYAERNNVLIYRPPKSFYLTCDTISTAETPWIVPGPPEWTPIGAHKYVRCDTVLIEPNTYE